MALRAGGLTGLMNQPTAQVIDGSLKFDSGKKIILREHQDPQVIGELGLTVHGLKRGDLLIRRGLFSTFGSSHPTTALKFGSSHVLEFLDYQGGYIYKK